MRFSFDLTLLGGTSGVFVACRLSEVISIYWGVNCFFFYSLFPSNVFKFQYEPSVVSWRSLNALPRYSWWILDGLRSEQIEEICERLTTDADASDNENHSRPCAASDKMTTYPAQQCSGLSIINKCDRCENKDPSSFLSYGSRFENSISEGKWVEGREGKKKKRKWKRRRRSRRRALKLYSARLMPTVEAAESLWEMSACISRGIKENMQRKSRWKDKCVDTLWGAQKGKLSLGNSIKYIFTLNPQWILSNFILCLQCHCAITLSLAKLSALGSVVSPQCEGNRWINLISDSLYLAVRARTGAQHWMQRLQFNENPPWKLTLYLFDPLFCYFCIKSRGIDCILLHTRPWSCETHTELKYYTFQGMEIDGFIVFFFWFFLSSSMGCCSYSIHIWTDQCTKSFNVLYTSLYSKKVKGRQFWQSCGVDGCLLSY